MNENRNDYLYHHGIKGQKWGVRRFQNADGTRTAAGKKRYGETMTLREYTKHLEREYPNDSEKRRAKKRELRSVKKKKTILSIPPTLGGVALGYAAVGSVLSGGATIPLAVASGASIVAGRAIYSHYEKKQRQLEWELL